jgi:hypothetical protein
MTVLLENAYELEVIAREIGAIFLKGHLRYPSETGGWQLGDLDLDEYPAKFRDRKLALIVAPISDVEPATVTCGICGFVMNEAGECASPAVTVRCKLEIAERARTVAQRPIVDTGEDRDVVDQVADWLDSEGGAA